MPLSLRFSPRSEADLVSLSTWIAGRADADTARDYIARIRSRCLRLLDAPRGGRVLRTGRSPVRSVPFERGATILYRVGRTDVIILRVLPRGRDVDKIVGRRA